MGVVRNIFASIVFQIAMVFAYLCAFIERIAMLLVDISVQLRDE